MKKQMKRLGNLVAAMLSLHYGNAQFTITPIQPPPQFVLEDVWNLSISGPNTSTYTQFYVSMRISSEYGDLKVKSNSSTFPLSAIPLSVTSQNLGVLSPISTLYYDNVLQSAIQNGGYFPPGTYVIEFILFGRPNDGEFTDIAEFNYTVEVDVFIPPFLLTPFDKDTITTPYPMLTWTPAYASSGTVFAYDLWLVKVQTNQTGYQAITSNPYQLNENGLNSTVLNYPPSATNLENGGQYAWQVAATYNNIPVAYSEVWTFVYYVDTLLDTNNVKSKVFFNLARSGTNGELEALRSVDEFLKFQIAQDYNKVDTIPLKFFIKDKNDSIVYNSAVSNYYPINYGMNRYVIDPCVLGLDEDHPYYKLEVVNNKNEWFYTYFNFAPGFECND